MADVRGGGGLRDLVLVGGEERLETLQCDAFVWEGGAAGAADGVDERPIRFGLRFSEVHDNIPLWLGLRHHPLGHSVLRDALLHLPPR